MMDSAILISALGGPFLATVIGLTITAIVSRQFEGATGGVVIGVIAGGGAMIAAWLVFSIIFASLLAGPELLEQLRENQNQLEPTN
ncbi:MAG: hypothetical protein AAF557_22075 [Pseudomonadota bacterium]